MHQSERAAKCLTIVMVVALIVTVLVAVMVGLSNDPASIEAESVVSETMAEGNSQEASSVPYGFGSKIETDKAKDEKEDKKESSSTPDPKEEIAKTESQNDKQDKAEEEPQEMNETDPIGPEPAPLPVLPTPKPGPTKAPEPTKQPIATPVPTPVATATPEPTPKPCEHDYVIITTVYEANKDGTHIVIVTYSCKVCNDSYEDTEQEECKYGEWEFDGVDTDFAECELCEDKITRKHEKPEPSPTPTASPTPVPTPAPTPKPIIPPPVHRHNYILAEVTYEPQQDGTHVLTAKYSCTGCGSSYPDKKQEDCTYGEWEYVGEGKETASCKSCGYSKTRDHQHKEIENLECVFDSSNSDGTHRYVSSYTCSICTELVTVYKNEDCDYGESSWRRSNANDHHEVFKTCKICMYEESELVACTPTGDYKCMDYNGIVYNYRDCEVCGDWCDRSFHTEHIYGEWETNPSYHIRYCLCVNAREKGDHEWIYKDEDGMASVTCKICGYSEPVASHSHGEGLYNDMDRMELVMHPTYQADKIPNVTQTPQYNPNPSFEEAFYCFRHQLSCHICHKTYYIYYTHTFKADGLCSRGNCALSKPKEEEVTAVHDEPEQQENETVDLVPDSVVPEEVAPEGVTPEEIVPEEVTPEESPTETVPPDVVIPPDKTPPDEVISDEGNQEETTSEERPPDEALEGEATEEVKSPEQQPNAEEPEGSVPEVVVIVLEPEVALEES